MKRLAFLGLFALSCWLFAPRELNLSYDVADKGMSVLVSWSQVDSASWYRVSVDGALVDSTDSFRVEMSVYYQMAGGLRWVVR